MAQIGEYSCHTSHKRASFPGTTSLFVGSFDDNMFCHGPQFVKPIDTSFITTKISTISRSSSLTSSVISDDDDIAVLGDDDDEYSEDELPPSPKRRHSGAISISEEELPLCLDREALRRETAAHRARQLEHHHHHAEPACDPKPLTQHRVRASTFSVHEQWDSEVDGPSMALWVPEQTGAECKRRRTEQSSSSSTFRKSEVPRQHHVSCIEGPMMCLWEA